MKHLKKSICTTGLCCILSINSCCNQMMLIMENCEGSTNEKHGQRCCLPTRKIWSNGGGQSSIFQSREFVGEFYPLLNLVCFRYRRMGYTIRFVFVFRIQWYQELVCVINRGWDRAVFVRQGRIPKGPRPGLFFTKTSVESEWYELQTITSYLWKAETLRNMHM